MHAFLIFIPKQDWNKAAQQEREERDCGTLVKKSCESCGKTFELELHLKESKSRVKRGQVLCNASLSSLQLSAIQINGPRSFPRSPKQIEVSIL